ncbi:acyl-CoA dehydrogenase [Sphingomonas sp. CL5.1]|uniref:FAS1-like dehydratase domain-containing protein n=1 Tax=Sphingomonas sp. CL5.1 TaxID=2653203 RepID=UPI001581A873|nr:MaoC family dehydratase N-terminal domain-containing protein [Sphingomonas sp. CL5.1]QKR99261.1 acyl-CoA dehydrogenase [Sphingomonas sp. CL5.1]
MTEIDIDHLRQWIGRTETATDGLSLLQAMQLAATLDRGHHPAEGQPLPPLWHWLYFAPHAPHSELGDDGHARRGGFLPPVPLPRRMWAGGRLTFHHALRIGETVTRKSEILSVSEKFGAQGALVFVTIRHTLSNVGGPAVEEEQDIVYREAGVTPRSAAAPAPLRDADWREAFTTDPTHLFRWSAVTFNAHRIHYDLPYATKVEGYPGLVVQGPLTATLLLEAYRKQTGRTVRSFSFRGQAPLFCGDTVVLCGRLGGEGFDLWAEGPGGYLAMAAKATGEVCRAD